MPPGPEATSGTTLATSATPEVDHSGAPVGTSAAEVAVDPSVLRVTATTVKGWQDGRTCPRADALERAVGTSVTDAGPGATLSATGLGCSYRLDSRPPMSLGIALFDQDLDHFRSIWNNDPPSVVQDVPELGPDAVLVTTPPSVSTQQCLVAARVTEGTLVVQITATDAPAMTNVCRPLGPVLTVLARRTR